MHVEMYKDVYQSNVHHHEVSPRLRSLLQLEMSEVTLYLDLLGI